MNIFLIAIYFLIAIIIGINSYKKVKSSKDFFVGGKQSGILQVSGSILATVLGSSAIIGSINNSYKIGWAGSWLMLCAAFGLLSLLPLTKYLKDFKGYNLPSLLESFYGKEVKKIASLIIAIAWVGVVATQIMGGSQILMILIPITRTQGILLCGTVFVVYTVLGGQLSVLKTDFIQLIFIIFGIVLTYFFTSSTPITLIAPSFINPEFSKMDLIVMLLTYSTTYIVGPDIYSRLFCAKDNKTIKLSLMISIIILVPLALIFSKIGIYAMQELPNLSLKESSVLLSVASIKLPKLVSICLYFSLLSAVISSADTTLLTGATLLTEVISKDIDNQKGVFITRISIIILGIISIFLSIKMTNIIYTILLALGIYAGAVIVPTIMGMLGYRGRKEVVIVAMVIGGIISLLGKKYGIEIGKILGIKDLRNAGNYICISAFLFNFAILILGSKLFPKEVSNLTKIPER
ncbi:sodium:solute symporter family protein [Fusobacterium sp. PH5-44]|uniref:sodium:solute symporter family protein n=1 Tax=unclassified Fusobacterium TaxID=2648384 RepID=UPI003D252828